MVKNWHEQHKQHSTIGQRVADVVASGMGSWKFIITQSVIVVAWITLNVTAYVNHWDPYPFILLNLLFSTQASYAAPIIMMAQNRQADRDRIQAEADFKTNIKSEEEIRAVKEALSRIEQVKLTEILHLLQKSSKEK